MATTSEFLSKGWTFSQSKIRNLSIFTDKTVANLDANSDETIYSAIMDGNSFMYVSCQNYIYKYSIGNYLESGNFTFAEEAKKFNPNQDIIIAVSPTTILSAQTYLGNVVLRDKDTLDINDTFENIGSPFKAEWSTYHNAYFVIGNNSLWKIDTVSDRVFAIDGYEIKDFAVSSYGQIAMVLSSTADNKDVLKVIDNDFYKNCINSDFGYGTLKKVVWAGNVFFAIEEKSSTNAQYVGNAILADPLAKVIETLPINATIQVAAKEQVTSTTKAVDILLPAAGDTLTTGTEYEITWLSTKSASDFVSINLLKDGQEVSVIDAKALNAGKYKWKLPSDLELSNKYSVQISWLTSNQSQDNIDVSEVFVISDAIPPPATLKSSDMVSGISYDASSNSVMLSFFSGHVGLHNLTDRKFYGLFVSGITDLIGCLASNDQIKQFTDVNKVRVFVGSDKYLSDKWDSGVVETNLTSMYYGGGNNLERGERYYVHIQVHSEKYGWSDVQINEFIMPL